VTMVVRCDRCGAELEAHLPERNDWQRTWDAERGCMRHECPGCAGRGLKKGKKR
jgi:DNA-directed RNA polymerase subunit RPC12/RpoP